MVFDVFKGDGSIIAYILKRNTDAVERNKSGPITEDASSDAKLRPLLYFCISGSEMKR